MSVDDAVPTISLHRAGGGEVTIRPERDAAPWTLRNGSEGLGVAPVSFSTSPRLAGHGSVLRGKRLGEREIFVPVMLEAETMSAANAHREELLRFLSPLDDRELTLRVTVPGRPRWREIPVHYAEGLQGDYGAEYYGTWETRGLVFKAMDALWRGEPVSISQQVDPATKPFLSATEPFFPVVLSDSTIAGRIHVDVAGDAPTSPLWTVVPPGEDLTIQHVGTGERFFLDGLLTETVRLDMATGRLWSDTYPDGELWEQASTDTRLFQLRPGRNEVEFSMVGATADSMVHVTYAPRFLAGY